MNASARYRARALRTLLLMFGLLLSGCGRLHPSEAQSPPSNVEAQALKDVSSVSVDSVSYRHDRSMKYTLFDLSQNPPSAVGGEIVGRLASGGSKGCCLALPNVWHPGLKVRVEWAESDHERSYPDKYSHDLEIPRYDHPSDLYVVFYPEHQVEVVVSRGEPGHPEWQGRVKETPWDFCVAKNGRKTCKAALPKLFDTKSSQGYCTWLKRERRKDAEEGCAWAMQECMRDYEDESFCKSILWGASKE